MTMPTMSATDVKNRIGDLWNAADIEPVTVERNGSPRYVVASVDKYVAIPREEYDRLRGLKAPPRLGFAKALFAGVDTDALLEVDLTEAMRDYL
ncbi:hypothetical protein CCAX7_004420 [Capsulimonas corticalis]|uniref:Uncharacterized protein n=1 Tax=Capsulimonas corticalis TaxID=2219043 RepID=A0A402D343_9BACT|nr:type II toxin-antitoxin system Phd/YefM family antitoxin [Capsulimonas corticalis]BDI28391.1 hypothetical protein CCAX7_004420 [Capsulimonas corticalis]